MNVTCVLPQHPLEDYPDRSVTTLSHKPNCYCDGCVRCSLASQLSHANVETFISGFKVCFLFGCWKLMYICFDRYRDYYTKSITRYARAINTRVHQLYLKTPLPARDAVLKNSANKAHLNTLICEQILIDEDYLKTLTQDHRLVVTDDKAVPTQVYTCKGHKTPRLDLTSTYEESDIITQQAIHLAKECPESRVCVVCDDTDVFPLLIFFYLNEKLQSSMTMQSPIKGLHVWTSRKLFTLMRKPYLKYWHSTH